MKGAPESLEPVITLLCRPDLTVGIAVTELGNLNMVGVIGSQGGRRQVAALNTKGKVGIVTIVNSGVKAAV